MQANETSGQERTDLEVTVCANGVVNVHRSESDRAHSVFVDGGDVVRCSCKGYHFHGHCSHQDAVEDRPLVVSSATAAAASTPRVATDGGQRGESPTGGDERRENGSESGYDTETDVCERCGEPEPLGPNVNFADLGHCPEYEGVCSDCILEHGPDACDHDETDDEPPAGPVISTATGWGTTDRRVPDDEDEDVDRTPL